MPICYNIRRNRRGRHGFDADVKTQGACRGRSLPRKTSCNQS